MRVKGDASSPRPSMDPWLRGIAPRERDDMPDASLSPLFGEPMSATAVPHRKAAELART